MSGFKDHFSGASDRYAAFRPHYPDTLFAWLASLVAERETAWDCATGSGQAALGLAAHFGQVIATDASAAQLAETTPHPRIDYRVAPAEASGLGNASIDLVTVAQAAHWFDLPRFYAETKRVLKPGGVLALWGYGRMVLPGALDAPFRHFYSETLGAHWPPERALIDDAYRSLDFPFEPIESPPCLIEVDWTLDRFLEYVSTWSAVRRYGASEGHDALPALRAALEAEWGDVALRLRWPLFLRVGRARLSVD